MRKSFLLLVATCVAASAADSSLTIYNQDFAVVRQTLTLDLHEGMNEVRFSDTTAHLEPSSVILRDPAGKVSLQILEQNYRADPVTQSAMLLQFEGQTIDFQIEEDHKRIVIPGKIIRSGYDRTRVGSNEELQPIIEVEGKLRFDLPGAPLFPSLANDNILKPELNWQITTPAAAQLEAEVAYITRKMSWKADYNVVAEEKGNVLSLVGWVTIENKSGKKFENTQTKLVAGDLNRVEPREEPANATTERVVTTGAYIPVSEKEFDEYHLYTLPRPLTLRDQEAKQVEFVRAEGVQSERIYLFNSSGGTFDTPAPIPAKPELDPGSDSQWQKRISVVCEFKNSEANRLGMPLPKGRWRFYRRDAGQLEFTGENEIEHTAKDETLRIFTGYAFDLVGEKRRLDFAADNLKHTADESFEIKLRNHKKEPVEIRVVEYLWRWTAWEITQKSDPYTRKDAQSIEFRVKLKPNEEKLVTYKVHYTQL